MTDIGQVLACLHFFTWRDPDRARSRMGIDSVTVSCFDDEMVAGQKLEGSGLFCIESPGILDKNGEVPGKPDRISFGQAIFDQDYDPGGSREDGPTPTKTVLQLDAEREILEWAGAVETRASFLQFDTYEIVCVSLA
jgi:hypothetical protein